MIMIKPIYEYRMQANSYALYKIYSNTERITKKMKDCANNMITQKFYKDLGMIYWKYGNRDDFQAWDQIVHKKRIGYIN